MRWSLLVMALVLVPSFAPSRAEAQEEVRLSEIIPALAGSPTGALSLGPAPAPGSSRVVTRAQVLAALRQNRVSARGLHIPRRVQIRREARVFSAAELAALALHPAQAALTPCRVSELVALSGGTTGVGAVDVRVEAQHPRASGSVRLMIVLSNGDREHRVPAQARVACPPPIVGPGSRITIVARYGAVSARAPGVARQSGRVGDVIRVRLTENHTSLRARVIDSHTAQVVQ